MDLPSKYLDLLKYATPCPDQHQGKWGSENYSNCGSCHNMACTGAMEIVNNKLKGIRKFEPLGDHDLSERWMMNMVTKALKNKNYNWIADKALIYNQFGRTMLQRDYPFTKGKFKGKFSANYNWILDLPEDWEKEEKSVPVPKLKREVLFGSCKDDDIYEVGVLDESHIIKIKEALVKFEGPVLAIYGGEDGFHSVLIVGYDDDECIGKCKYVQENIKEKDEMRKERYQKLIKSVEKQGWRENGVFYVRESEYYPEPEGFYAKIDTIYDYGGLNKKHWQPYVAPYVRRSYDWMKFLGNHAVVIYADPNQEETEGEIESED